ncbi:unnamed protein product, partial [Allacma fusca]
FFDGNNLFGTGFFSTKYNEDVSFPDVEAYMMYLGLSHVTPIIWSKLLNTHDELFASLIESYEGMDGNMALVSLMRTQSYGYVALNGTNPFNPPIIDTNLFSDPDNMDIKRLVEGMKLMVEFYENSTTYQSIGARLLPVPWPGCEKFVFKSLEYYECYIRHLTFTLWHAAGTCKMGRADDPMAVVDTRLRVLGIQNVRVVDTSIMPRITNGNTNAPALMIGEKAADMIIRDNGGFTVFPVLRQVEIFRQEDYVNNYIEITTNVTEIYDFIIVGGGTSGAVLANRLTTLPNKYRVLVLEAGNDPPWISYYTGYDIFAPNNQGLDWKYLSQPQRNCCLSCFGGRTGAWRGLGLGGSSLVNFGVYNRGNPGVFDQWADIAALFHGCGGEMGIDKNLHTPGLEYFLPAIRDHKLTEQDVNVNQTNTFMRTDQTSMAGVRSNTYLSFLLPILGRKNLHINRNSIVTKLLYDPLIPNKVCGVEYIRFNYTKKAYATREVILSAGAFNSPKILMLSGIGPKGDLMELNISVVKDLPVGKKMQDHPATLFPIVFDKPNTSLLYERDVIPGVLTNALYPPIFTQGFFQGNNVMGVGYHSTKYNDDATFPDIEGLFIYLGVSHLSPSILEHLLNIDRDLFHAVQKLYEGRDGNMVLVSLTRPSSVGYVCLNGTNPLNNPIINPNLYTDLDDMDIKRMVQGMKYMVDFYENSTAYKSIGARLIPVPWPGCHKLLFKSLEYYECYIRHVTFTQWHACGTCRMGKVDDRTAVVDSRLRVHGVLNLRVVDTSIMPRVPNGNTMASAVMIAEKAADMIIRDHGGVTRIPGSQEPCPIPFHLRDEL